MSHTDGGDRSGRSARASGGDLQGAATKPKKGAPPPLAWLIIGLLVVIALVAWLTTNGSRDSVRPGPSAPLDAPEAPLAVEPATTPPPAPAAAPTPVPQATPSNVTPP